jgi:hypothetical protein
MIANALHLFHLWILKPLNQRQHAAFVRRKLAPYVLGQLMVQECSNDTTLLLLLSLAEQEGRRQCEMSAFYRIDRRMLSYAVSLNAFMRCTAVGNKTNSLEVVDVNTNSAMHADRNGKAAAAMHLTNVSCFDGLSAWWMRLGLEIMLITCFKSVLGV